MIKTQAKIREEDLYLHWDGQHVYLKLQGGLDLARYTLDKLSTTNDEETKGEK